MGSSIASILLVLIVCFACLAFFVIYIRTLIMKKSLKKTMQVHEKLHAAVMIIAFITYIYRGLMILCLVVS